MELRAASIIDAEIEGHYALLPFVEDISTREHRHDFYEIFLIAEGSIHHQVNDTEVLLATGAMVFIRPDDAHYFRKHDDHNCQLINIAFLTKTYRALVAYLDLPSATLHDSPLPPTVLLTVGDKNAVATSLKAWGRQLYQDKAQSRLRLRGLLARMLAAHFVTAPEGGTETIPDWLAEVCTAMRQQANVVEGRDALIRLANRTPEYIGRSFQAHLGVTPSEFINNLRLDYARDLLLQTADPVTEICYRVGFGNLSHFHHLFKARWGCSPNQFRRFNQRTVVP